MSATAWSCAFWISVTALFFTYVGYPFLVATLAAGRRRREAPQRDLPLVSVVLVARNEEGRIRARLENLLASDYPADRLEIIMVSDGSTDGTLAAVAALNDPRITLIAQPERRGKAAGLNAGVSRAKGGVIVFADARQTFDSATIGELARRLSDPGIGAVSGELEIAASASGAGKGIDAYWRLEKFLRSKEAELDSCIGCTGAVYALRRELFSPIPEDTILDDVVIPMQAALRGARVAFASAAKAFDPQPLAPEIEARRKQRTLAGNFQMLFRYPEWLLPWRNRLWWQLISHKYLRLVAPVFLLVAAIANAMLARVPVYTAAAVLQLGFYACALLGLRSSARAFSIPAGFVFLNVNVVRAFFHYLATRNSAGWAEAAPARRDPAQP